MGEGTAALLSVLAVGVDGVGVADLGRVADLGEDVAALKVAIAHGIVALKESEHEGSGEGSLFVVSSLSSLFLSSSQLFPHQLVLFLLFPPPPILLFLVKTLLVALPKDKIEEIKSKCASQTPQKSKSGQSRHL